MSQHTLEPQAIETQRCPCGGRVIEDLTPFHELYFGQAARRFKCFSCGRDGYVRAGQA